MGKRKGFRFSVLFRGLLFLRLAVGRWRDVHPGLKLTLTATASMAYNTRMIFVETKLFTDRILDALSDDEYAEL